MPLSLTCPTDRELHDLLAGSVSDERAEELERHLVECAVCNQRTLVVGHSNTFISAIKAQAIRSAENPQDAEVISQVTRRVQEAVAESIASTATRLTAGDANTLQFDPAELLNPPQAPDEIGRLAGFRVFKLLGTGGMGVVFLAEDAQLQRRIALKTLKPEFAARKDAAERFLREARAAAAVKHEHVVTIYQVGEAVVERPNGSIKIPFLAQELLEGESLEDCLRRESPLPINEAVRIGAEIAEGLAAAHAKGLIHRDIKPANVWLERAEGQELRGKGEDKTTTAVSLAPQPSALSQPRVKILDFGLARSTDTASQITSSGMIVGTPSYMAPEQASGDEVDARADLFSLGCVLYRMTTGKLPFSGKKALEVLKQLATVTPASPHTVNPAVPQPLSDLIDRLLQKDRDARPATAWAVACELSRMAVLGRPDVTSLADVSPSGATTIIHDSKTQTQAVGGGGSKKRIGLALAASAALVVLGVIIIKFKDKDGRETKITVETPPGTKFVSVEQQDSEESGAARDKTGLGPIVERSPFDALDPAAIPAEERFEWQPKELVAVLGSHRQRLWGGSLYGRVSLTADGATAAVGCGMRMRGLLVDIAAGTESVAPFPPNSLGVALSPDGRMLFWQQPDKLGLLVKEGNEWHPRPLPAPRAFYGGTWTPDAVFSTDGRLLTTAVGIEVDKNVLQYVTWGWDVSVNPPKRLFDLPDCNCPSLSPDGGRLAVLNTKEKTVRVFELTATPPKTLCDLSTVEISTKTGFPRLGFLANGLLATLDRTSKLCLWDVSAAEPKLVAQRDVSKECGTGGGDGFRPFRSGEPRMAWKTETRFGTWRLAGDAIITEFTDSGGNFSWANARIRDIAVSDDGHTLATTHLNSMVRFWNLTDHGVQEKRPIQPQPGFVGGTNRLVQFAPDGRHFATRSEDGTRVWRLGGSACEAVPLAQTRVAGLGPVAFIDQDHVISSDGTGPRKWKIEADRVKDLEPLSDEQFFPLHRLPNGLLLACRANPNGQLSLWDGNSRPAKPVCSWTAAPNGRTLANNYAPNGWYAVSADGRILATVDLAAGQPETIRLWQINAPPDPPTEITTITPTGGQLQQLALSRDGQRLAVGHYQALSLWSLNGKQVENLWLKSGPTCAAVAFTPDDQHLAAAFRFPYVDHPPDNVSLFSITGDRLAEWPFPHAPNDLAFAPDGRHLLTVNTNGTVYILRTKLAPSVRANDVATVRRGSPDPAASTTEGLPGGKSASKSGDRGSSNVARSETGQNKVETGHNKLPKSPVPLRKPVGETTGPVSPSALVPNPAKLAGLKSWTLETISHRTNVTVGEANPARTLLAVGDADSVVRVWDMEHARLHRVLLPQWTSPTGTRAVSWSGDGQRLAVRTQIGSTQAVDIWDIDSGKRTASTKTTSTFWRNTLAWSPRENVVLIIETNGLTAWNLDSDEKKTVIPAGDNCQGVAWNPSGEQVAVIFKEGTLKLYDAKTWQETKTLGNEPGMFLVSWSPRGDLLATSHKLPNGGYVNLWNAEGDSAPRALAFDEHSLTHDPRMLAWSADGRQLLVNTMSKNDVHKLARFDVASGKLIQADFSHMQSHVQCGSFVKESDVTWLVTADAGRVVATPRNETAADAKWTLIADYAESRVNRELWHRFSPDGDRLLRAFYEHGGSWQIGDTHLIDTNTLETVGKQMNFNPYLNFYTPSWTSSQELLAVPNQTSGVSVFGPALEKRIDLVTQPNGKDRERSLDWSPDEKRLAGTMGETIQIWELPKNKPIAIWTAHPGGATRLDWAPNGQWLASGGNDKIVKIWDAQTQKLDYESPVFAGRSINHVAWSPDSSKVLAASDTKDVGVLDVAAESLTTFQVSGKTASVVGWDESTGAAVTMSDSGVIQTWDTTTLKPLSTIETNHAALTAALLQGGATIARANRLYDTRTGVAFATWVAFFQGRMLKISAEGNYLGPPDIDKELIVVAETEDGHQLTLSLAEFREKYGWKNEPDKAKPLKLVE